MRKPILILIASLLFLAPTAVQAGGPKGCPPGLAKKSNGCLPPGQAKKIYGPGDRINSEYVPVRNPGLYGLDPGQTYYRVGDYVYRVDSNTKKVLDLIGAVNAILN